MAHDPRDVRPAVLATSADSAPAPHTSAGAVLTAIVDDISPDGVARIVVTGESHPRDASSLLRFGSAAAASEALLGQTVVVLVGAAEMPIILGPVSQRLWEQRGDEGPTEIQTTLPTEAVQVRLDKRRVELEATDEIRLTCGKSALVMRRDGTVIVRGVKIVSRATETNRIMGGTVGIN